MSFWKRFTGVALLFALGFLAGAIVSSSLDLNSAADGPKERKHAPSPLSDSFYADLELNPEQRAAVEAIAEKYRSGLSEIRRSVAPRIQEMLALAEQEIEPILDAQQKARYQAQRSEWEERHRRFVEKQRQQSSPRPESKTDSR